MLRFSVFFIVIGIVGSLVSPKIPDTALAILAQLLSLVVLCVGILNWMKYRSITGAASFALERENPLTIDRRFGLIVYLLGLSAMATAIYCVVYPSFHSYRVVDAQSWFRFGAIAGSVGIVLFAIGWFLARRGGK